LRKESLSFLTEKRVLSSKEEPLLATGLSVTFSSGRKSFLHPKVIPSQTTVGGLVPQISHSKPSQS